MQQFIQEFFVKVLQSDGSSCILPRGGMVLGHLGAVIRPGYREAARALARPLSTYLPTIVDRRSSWATAIRSSNVENAALILFLQRVSRSFTQVGG